VVMCMHVIQRHLRQGPPVYALDLRCEVALQISINEGSNPLLSSGGGCSFHLLLWLLHCWLHCWLATLCGPQEVAPAPG
jgi:hypothetical protein